MKNLLSKTKYLLLLTVLFIGSCEEKVDTQPVVLTENIIFISGEILRVTGRIVSVGEVPVSDHGFEIAENDAFTSPITVSLGERSIPGRFIGEYNLLNTGTDYFVRAFAIVDGTAIYGNATPFTSLVSEITRYEPQRQSVGNSVNIFGRNFTQDVEIFFGSKKATIAEFNFESLLRVRVPTPVDGEYTVDLRIISGGEELIYPEKFDYVTGKWTETSELPESLAVNRNIHFFENGSAYYGYRRGTGGAPNYFLRYDIAQDQWDQVTYTGQLIARPFTFEGGFIGGIIPIGPGANINSTEFWVIDNNGDFQLEGQVPFALNNGKTFRIGDQLWLFGGRYNNNAVNTVAYVYDFNLKTWNVHDTAPIDILDDFPAFEHNGLMYFVSRDKELWRYTPQTRTWEVISTYPGSFSTDIGGINPKNDGIGVRLGDFAYLGLAREDRNIWEYDILNNSWAPKTPHPSTDNDEMIAWYAVNDRFYALRTNRLFGGNIVFWEFNPFSL